MQPMFGSQVKTISTEHSVVIKIVSMQFRLICRGIRKR